MKKNNKVKNFKGTFRRLLSYYRNYKWDFFITVILGIISAATLTASIYLVGVIYNNYLDPNPANPSFVDLGIWENFIDFIFILVGLFITYLINNLFYYLQNRITSIFSEKASYKLRQDVFKKLQALPIKYFDQTPSGELMSRITNDIDNIDQTVSQYGANIIYWILSIIGMLILMLLVSPALTGITLITIPILIAINIFIVVKINPYFFKQQQKIGKLNGFVEEMVSGTKIISLFRMQDKVSDNFRIINEELTKDSIIAQATSNIMMPINNFVNNISFFILSALGISLILLGTISTESIIFPSGMSAYSLLIMFTLFSRNFTNPINQIIATASSVLFMFAGAERVFEIMDQQEENDKLEAKEIKNIKGYVEFKNLCFGYDPNKLILKNLNFKANPGEMTAIVGPTGAGKTTIVNLITKFYDLTSGEILIDDKEIEDIKRESLRKNITMVLQDTYLFGESVKKNIKYGRQDATDEEVIQAAKKANAHNFIMQLPHGYDTVLEDNGGNLSQGQRQLLAIARAFLADSKIVILDEATSSIDTKTEMEIQSAMDQLMKNRTSFVIAHRLSTIKNANTILVLKNGEIVESGKHQQLIAKNGFYAKLYNTQFKKGMEI